MEASRPTGARRAGLAAAGPARLPRAAARPARHRPIEPGRRAAGLSPAEQAEYLTHFRADSIVRDAELLRARARQPAVEPCSARASAASASPATSRRRRRDSARGVPHRRAAAGRAPGRRRLPRHLRPLLERNRRYYARYPEDRERVRELQRRLEAEEVLLPSGDRLIAAPLPPARELLGMSDGAEKLHYSSSSRSARPRFLHDVEAALPPFARNPLYAVDPRGLLRRRGRDTLVGRAPAARRVRGAGALHRRARLSLDVRGDTARCGRCARRPSCSRSASGRGSTTPSACARTRCRPRRPMYAEDMYVERAFSEETAALDPRPAPVGHERVRAQRPTADGERILGRLIDLARGRAAST